MRCYGPFNTHISVLGVQPVFPPDAAIIPDEGKVSVRLMGADVHLQGQAGQQGEGKEQQESHPDSSLVQMWGSGGSPQRLYTRELRAPNVTP